MTQNFSVMINQLVAALQQRGVVTMLFDHVAQFTKVMNQKALTTFVLIVLLQRAQQIADHVFKFSLFHLKRDCQRAFEHQLVGRLFEAAFKQRAQSLYILGPHRDWAGLVEHVLQFQHGGYEVEGADMARLVASHIEPEFMECRIVNKNLGESCVQTHALFFKSDRCFQ